jgi:ferritin-like metal-binding protein YciE
MSELQEMLIDQLRDAASAEKQAIQGMRRMQRKASDQLLRDGIENHIAQSESQLERVMQCLEQMSGGKRAKMCQGMRGLVEEAQEELGEHEKGPVLDLVIVAALQRVEHYEIAAYGTMAELAKSTGHEDAAEVLAQILEEEKQQDIRLTDLTRESLMQTALEASQSEGEEDEEEERPRRRAAPRKAAAAPRGRSRTAAPKASTRSTGTRSTGRNTRGATKTGTRGRAR